MPVALRRCPKYSVTSPALCFSTFKTRSYPLLYAYMHDASWAGQKNTSCSRIPPLCYSCTLDCFISRYLPNWRPQILKQGEDVGILHRGHTLLNEFQAHHETYPCFHDNFDNCGRREHHHNIQHERTGLTLADVSTSTGILIHIVQQKTPMVKQQK